MADADHPANCPACGCPRSNAYIENRVLMCRACQNEIPTNFRPPAHGPDCGKPCCSGRDPLIAPATQQEPDR